MNDKGITVRLVKYGHACVRVETEGAVLVIDPGKFSEPEALDGADAVLITHEHFDHFDMEKLTAAHERRPLRIYTHAAVSAQLIQKVADLPAEKSAPQEALRLAPIADAVTTVGAGDEFEAAGLPVKAFGGVHAEIHRDIPLIANLGYVIGDAVYHPGDSFVVPEGVEVQTLFVPISAPWARFADSIDFLRAVSPHRAFALHDALLSDTGLSVYNANMRRLAGDLPYSWIEPGQPIPPA